MYSGFFRVHPLDTLRSARTQPFLSYAFRRDHPRYCAERARFIVRRGPVQSYFSIRLPQPCPAPKHHQ